VILASEESDLDTHVLGIEVQIERIKVKVKGFNANSDNLIRLETLLFEKNIKMSGSNGNQIYKEHLLVRTLLDEPKEIKRGLARLGKLHASACKVLGQKHINTTKIDELLLAYKRSVMIFGIQLPINELIPLLEALHFAASEIDDPIAICETKLLMIIINVLQGIKKFKPYWVIVLLIVLRNYMISSFQA
jgi:hypothetical protein